MFPLSRPSVRRVALLACVLPFACSGDDPAAASRPGKRAQGRKGDPELVHHWEMPADKAVLQSADLGSDPPALADALMANSVAPSLSHRMTNACAEKGSLAGTATVALRWKVDDAGAIKDVEGDPAGAAADCFAEQLPAMMAKAELTGLPAGAALLVLRFHGRSAKAPSP